MDERHLAKPGNETARIIRHERKTLIVGFGLLLLLLFAQTNSLDVKNPTFACLRIPIRRKKVGPNSTWVEVLA